MLCCIRPIRAQCFHLHRPLAQHCQSYHYIPSHPTWSPASLSSLAPVLVADDDMARLLTLSNLTLPREGGEDSAYERVRKDVGAVLAAARSLQPGAGVVAAAAGGAGAGAEGGTLEAQLDALSEEELEALARVRWGRLRPDVAGSEEGAGSDGVVAAGGEGKASTLTHGGFFRVPKFSASGEE